MPRAIQAELLAAYAGLADEGEVPIAVRSSATAEDLPSASFAGQQDTFLNIQGEGALLDAVQKCWAGLWTARAISYRARQDIHPATSLTVEDDRAILVPQRYSGNRQGVLVGSATKDD